MTSKEALAKAIKKLNKKNIKNPHFDAEILLSSILKKEREFLLAHLEKKLTKSQLEKFNKLINRRIKGEPVAYLLGYKYFYGNKFIVNKDVLVPRPETEMMIESIINYELSITNSTIIDVGTGSGCIIISLAKLLKNKKIKFIGTDISKKALIVARKNAKLNGVDDRIQFLQGNLLKPIFNFQFSIKNSNIIITANLPYLTPKQVQDSPSIQKEPKLALVADEDGLKYYKKLFKQVKDLKCASVQILCEIDPSQTSNIKQLIKKELPQAKFEIKKDLAGLDRLVVISYKWDKR